MTLSFFCDGSIIIRNGTQLPGGYGVTFDRFAPGHRDDARVVELSWQVDANFMNSTIAEGAAVLQGFRLARMRLNVVLAGMAESKRPSRVTIVFFSDSETIVHFFEANKFLDEILRFHPAFNQVLEMIALESRQLQDNQYGVIVDTQLRWVKGHRGRPWLHDRVDRIAKEACQFGSRCSMDGLAVPSVIDGPLKAQLEALYSSSSLPETQKKRKALKAASGQPPAKKARK